MMKIRLLIDIMNIEIKIIIISVILPVKIVWKNSYNIFNKTKIILNLLSVLIMVLRLITIFCINICSNMI